MTVAIDVPASVRTVVDDLVAAARESFGDALRSVLLYGSAAEGRLRASSDVNLLFVLRVFDSRADAFREPFRFAQAAANVNAMFLLDSELEEAGEAFAQKFADIANRHVVLYGEDIVARFSISRGALVRRLRQVLLNLSIRLREQYVLRSLREEQCAIAVAEAAGPLRTSAAAILELERGQKLAPKEALEELVREIGRPELTDLLPHLSEAREQRVLPAGNAAALLFATLDLARALHDRALRIDA
jgi:hypothetical protein